MNSIVDALYELNYNPFKYSEHLASFYASVGEMENSLLLAPLVIPICSHPFFSIKLQSANTNSSLWTIFDGETRVTSDRDKERYEKIISSVSKNKIVHREQLYDLQERINGFQNLTEDSIQYCLINDWLSIDKDNLTFCFCSKSSPRFDGKNIAQKLGRLFSGYSVIEIYGFLGVKLR